MLFAGQASLVGFSNVGKFAVLHNNCVGRQPPSATRLQQLTDPNAASDSIFASFYLSVQTIFQQPCRRKEGRAASFRCCLSQDRVGWAPEAQSPASERAQHEKGRAKERVAHPLPEIMSGFFVLIAQCPVQSVGSNGLIPFAISSLRVLFSA